MTMSHQAGERAGDDARLHFSAMLAEIRQSLVELGSMVAENLRRAGEAMREGRLDLIPQVRDADDIIDERFAELELKIFETMARQAPVAGDLRFLIAATRIIYEQERSGDLVVNCVNMLEREEGFPELANIHAILSRAVDASARVFAMSVDAIADGTPDAGAIIDRADDEVDELVSRFYTEVGGEADNLGLETAIALSRVGRFLERIADHGVNIGEHVTYIETARLPDHPHVTPSDQP
jgi:phosphate transport system protein